MAAQVAGALGITLTAIALVWGCYWKSRFHKAKAEVYQEFAETFGALVPVYWIKDKEQKKREAKRVSMRLALCDPLVRDGLRAAVAEADEHWARKAA